MTANDQDQQNTPVLPPERLARATTNPLSPSDLMIAPLAAGSTKPEASPEAPIALARINRQPLLHWLVAAINGVLAGELPAQPRPTGILLECGRFVAQEQDVWAYDWYGHGRGCLVARCANAAAAVELGVRLNGLLRG